MTREERLALFDRGLPTARKVAEKWSRRIKVPADDLVGEAMIGCWRAAKTYDPTRGTFERFVALSARSEIFNDYRRRGRFRRRFVCELNDDIVERSCSPSPEDAELLDRLESIAGPRRGPVLRDVIDPASGLNNSQAAEKHGICRSLVTVWFHQLRDDPEALALIS